MVQRKVALVLVSAFGIALVLAIFASGKLSWRKRRTYDEGLICHVERTLMGLDDGGHEESLECDVLSSKHDEMLEDMSITIELTPEFVCENRKALDTGMLYVHIPGGFVNEEYIEGFGTVGTSIEVPSGSDISVLGAAEVHSMQHRRRRHRRTFEQTRALEGTETRTVMVFRVTTDDASPEIGATEIDERMFSTTSFSFASQFDKCSFGQLTFEPYDSQTVTELYVPGEVSSFTERTILNAATRRAGEIFGKDIWDRVDHAVFCMPDGTSGKPYIAYSGVGSFFSVYHNLRCSYPTTVMHELAHNLGLGHAYEDGEEYGDETTIMGFSSSSKTGPSKCFNGQNIWHFGWFKSRSTMVDPFQGHQLLELAPFVDFDKTNLYQYVLITIFDMHIVYNRAKAFNAETSEYQNKVTIVKEEDEINSALLAVLDMDHPTHTVGNLLGSGRNLYIQLCESSVGVWDADYITVSVGLDYSVCPQPTPNPSERPTPYPTFRPTPWPTYFPTPYPTFRPTPTPSQVPTKYSTQLPSTDPTSELPNIILVPLKPPETDATDDLVVVFPWEETTHLPKKPENGRDRPLITLPTSEPTIVPTELILGNGTKAKLLSIQSINAGLQGEGPETLAAVLIASVLTLFVSCCACACFRCKQRRYDEQKRNLRVLQYNASSEVKIYMQDPV